jgi:subtilisin family serine protease
LLGAELHQHAAALYFSGMAVSNAVKSRQHQVSRYGKTASSALTIEFADLGHAHDRELADGSHNQYDQESPDLSKRQAGITQPGERRAMDETKYLVLHRAAVRRLAETAAHEMGDLGSEPGQPEREIVTIESFDEREAADNARDPDLVVSRSIPVSLVRPVDTDSDAEERLLQEAKERGGSWGVLEVAPKADENAGSSMVVAVLDTGIQQDHPAFRGIAPETRNFSRSPHDHDVDGHGTHCAATIFGRDVDGVRIGVARGVRRALIGKVLDDEGTGDTAAIAQAIQWAHQNGAQIISLSLGMDFARLVEFHEKRGKVRAEALSIALSLFRDTVRVFDALVHSLNMLAVLQRRGVILVAASGNESARAAEKPYLVDVSLPAAAIGVLSTGAVARGENGYEIGDFSNTNPQLCAPGVDVVSAKLGGGLCAKSGTSMATPHVAGLAALWWERTFRANPNADGELVRRRLLNSCRDTGFAPGVKVADRGAGLALAP